MRCRCLPSLKVAFACRSREPKVSSSKDCVFCRIARKRAQARIVYECDDFICFFPTKPDLYGHTLITSKRHYIDLRSCPPELGAGLLKTAQNLFSLYSRKLGSTGFNLLHASGKSAEQSVEHLHFHFLPRYSNDGLTAWPQLPPFDTDLDALVRLLTAEDREL